MEYLGIVVGAIAGFIVIYFYIWLLFLLPRKMAKKRGRSVVGWTIIFWIITPFYGAILLLILGDSKDKIKQDILNEINNRNNL